MTTRLDLLGITGLVPCLMISARGLLSYDRPATGRWPDCAPPFSTGGTPVSFDRCRVEREHHGIFARFSQGFKDCAPSAALGPAIEAIVDRGVRAVFARTVALT